ncbi:MAG: PepSY domain-containing protein [Pseudarcicella sp.]|jgi:hypothetical protein|nr:PepSY domain-containing protein [Pseudarcicella sp.]
MEKEINFKNNLLRYFYKCHRILGLITLVPVILWCLSGFMHPFLSHWFKPSIKNEKLPIQIIHQKDLKFSLQEVLETNKIEKFKNVRIISFDGKTYFQIKRLSQKLEYFDAQTAHLLENGDKKYAEWMARFFIDDHKSKVLSITQQSDFSESYKYINRLLPVWKVSFDRPDEMDVYVETSSSRLGTFNPNSRKVFLWIFDNFHNWSFVNLLTNNSLRIVLMLFFLTIISFSAISGIVIYGFMWKKFKKAKSKKPKGILRRNHRKIGLAVALVTLTFAFSGGFHATKLWKPNTLPQMLYEPIIEAKDLKIATHLLPIEQERWYDMSVIKKGKQCYYQFFYDETEDLLREKKYFSTQDGSLLADGDKKYAIYLAKFFLKKSDLPSLNCCEMDSETEKSVSNDIILNTETLNNFDKREYGFAFKRLPVVRVSIDSPEKTNLYIETATSRLAAKIENADRVEGYSFAIFHKFLFVDWAGKNFRDGLMIFSVLGILVVSILGFILFLKK